MKLLILDEGYGGRLRQFSKQIRVGDVVATKLDGFHRRRRQLRSGLGLRFERVRAGLEQLPGLIRGADADAVLFVPSWRYPAEEFRDTLAGLPGSGDRVPLAVFDTFDQGSSPFFGSLPFVDLYLKSQLLRDQTRYKVAMAGGNNLAEWAQDRLGFNLGDWHFGSTVPEGSEAKLTCGWNMGVSRFYPYLAGLSRVVAAPWRKRPIGLHRRFSIPDPARVAKWEWYQEYRRFCGLRTNELCGGIDQTGHDPLPRVAYLKELGRSRIVFSPFGWGEVCFRDFEAVASGAVLVKPNMAHLETYPDIYEDGVTYKAVRWDLSDLGDVCRWLLENPSEAERIADNARRRLLDFVDGGVFDARVRGMMKRLVVGGPDPTRVG